MWKDTFAFQEKWLFSARKGPQRKLDAKPPEIKDQYKDWGYSRKPEK